MRYWPEISFRCTDHDVNLKKKGKVNLFSEATNSGGAENFARCTRVLRKFDSCPGEKSVSSMSTIQNSVTTSRHCNTREPLWAEDFIDLTEFCQPSTAPIKMEDSVDECTATPIANPNTAPNTHHGFEYALEVNDLDNNIDDSLWRMPSPAMAMQDELCDPLNDWLSATKETNNNHNHNINHNNHASNINNVDNLSTRSEVSFDMSEAILNSRLMSVPNSSQIYHDKKTTMSYIVNEVAPSHQLHPESAFYATEPVYSNVHNPPSTSSQNLMLSRPETSSRVLSANSLFIDRRREPAISISATYSAPSHNQFLHNMKNVTSLGNLPTTAMDVVRAPRTVQSPSITQSNTNRSGEPTSSSIPLRRNAKLKLNVHAPITPSPCTVPTPEMLQPLVNKNSDFDLVSYVFDEQNKPPVPLDVSSLNEQQGTSTVNVPTMRNEVGVLQIDLAESSGNKPSSMATTIKTEPMDDAGDDRGHPYGKHKGEKDEDDPLKIKRMRRYSNCSSEDLTQLESEKYRELRNKNNEASRRSRANRKNREVEMKEHALQLESENRRLKVKAEEMEKLVKRLRSCLMQLVLKRR